MGECVGSGGSRGTETQPLPRVAGGADCPSVARCRNLLLGHSQVSEPLSSNLPGGPMTLPPILIYTALLAYPLYTVSTFTTPR